MDRWHVIVNDIQNNNVIKDDIFCYNECQQNKNCVEIHHLMNFSNYFFLNINNITKYKLLIDHPIVESILKYHNHFLLHNYIHLYPIITPPDGNCLFHAVAITLYGVPDRNLYLKNLILHFICSKKYIYKIKEYWTYELTKEYQNLGIKLTDSIIETEWLQEVESITKNNSQQGGLSIFLLANIIRRAIIIISPDNNQLQGLYLPFLIDFKIYNKNPIFIYFHNNHYTSLMLMKNNDSSQIILNNKKLVLHYYEGEPCDQFLSLWFNNFENLTCRIIE